MNNPASLSADLAHQTVLDGILRQAARTPDAVALVSADRQVSYRALARRVERWASGLRDRGVGAEAIVAILLPRSEDLVVAILAVLRAGAAYLPLDRAHPASRCREILSASGAHLLIADTDDLRDAAPIASPAALDARGGGPDAMPLPAGAQLAYVIYTSGSTGVPKGVAIEHAALLNHMRWMIAQFGTGAAARVLQRTSCAFDASVWELFLSLMSGGTLVMVDGDDHRDPAALRALIARETPSAMQCVPTFLRFALERGVFDGTSLAFVFAGGEALAPDVAADFRRRSTAALVNLYGPTETTVDTTWFDVDDGPCDGESHPIGRPIANVWAQAMSSRYEAAPDEVAAELWVGGAGIGRGYHRAPAATARAFVPDPFAVQPGMRAYRTGDLVRQREGVLTFVARADRLIKLNGYRVELGEIEAVLRQHPHVSDAVTQLTDAPGARALIAYCLRAGAEPETDAVRSYLLERLPHYMVPAQFVWLDRFPVKPNGKLDLSALRPPEAPARTGPQPEPPTTAIERTLATIWEGLFKRPVGVSDNFFEIGGDSIRSIQVISLAKKRGLTLKLQDVFECPTIRTLASRVGQATGGDETASAFALAPEKDRLLLDPARVEDAYPTTVLLDALYFLNETSPRYEVYVTSCELGASWEPEALGTALARVVERHPWLRTSFAYEGFSRPLQLVHASVPVRWDFEGLTHLSRGEQDQRLAAWMDHEKRNTFDWSRAPVWRVTIHHRAADRFQLTLSEPIFDGWSVSSFLGELLAEYSAACLGRVSPPRPRPHASYRDFVVAEQDALQDPRCVEFWRRALSANVGRGLPRPAGAPLEDRGVRRLEIRLSAEASDRLRDVGRRASAPLKSVLLAAHARVLATLTGRATVVSGVIMNGRAETPEAEQVLGLHINTAPLVLDLKTSRTWLDLIGHVFAAEKEALPYRRYPLAAVQKLHGRTPLFDAAFNFTHFHGLGESVRASGLRVLDYLAWDQTFFPLTAQFHVDVNDSTIGLGLDYDSGELAAEQMEEIAALYRVALEQIASAPERSCKAALRPAPAAAPVAAAPDAAAPDWEAAARDEDSVLERFRRIARAQPDAIALSMGDRQLSYATLSRAASALADDLRRMDVAERSVLVCFDTQYEAVIAFLALLDAGGIYLPVDPAFPTIRIEQIARNASASLCLCDAALARRLRETGLTTAVVDVAALCVPALCGSRASTDRAGSRPASAAYRIYTSGSTGTPKGVEIGHASLAHFLTAMRVVTDLSRDDVVLGVTTIAFDISLFEMLLPLTIGARLVAVEREICRDGERLGTSLLTSEATCCQATPTTWRMLLEAGARLPAGLKAVSGGEALSSDLAARLLAAGVTLTNAYGPTETTIWSTTARIRHAKAVTLGGPLGATSLRLSDAFHDECLPGVVGEIGIGGAGVAHGYVANPALTAARFTPDEDGHGGRCYRTGDCGRRTADGAIEFLGRLDDQVKVRGYRIELAEIEDALRACPGVRAAAVKAIGGDSPVLAGYVILDVIRDDRAPWDEDEAKRSLRRLLPEHMIPRHLVVVDAFPLTANQKIDRARLPAPDPAPRSGKRIFELFERVKAMSADDVKRVLAGQP